MALDIDKRETMSAMEPQVKEGDQTKLLGKVEDLLKLGKQMENQ